MSFKIYTINNLFYVVDNTTNKEVVAHKTKVLIDRETATSTLYLFKGIDNFNQNNRLELSDIQDFNGDPYTMEALKENPTDVVWRFGKGFLPIPIINFADNITKMPRSTAIAVSMVDAMGIGANTYSYRVNWEQSEGKELKAFKEEIGKEKFKEANEEYAKNVNTKILQLRKDERFIELDGKGKKKVLDKLKDTEKQKMFDKHDFEYESKTSEDDEITSEKADNIIEEFED